ncbi:putative pentatricopeptide repeat-containing protein At1g56570 [Ipomoea triloba]|uniref:putative pentatricopeptide repeat-containing protein At1g56570 n=1 Tax=Ipomoea triloba TaxID=35885 RepID=UPI00125E6520|nr:putative pentatricopeptide repeat-containing protein At1g56570 [Ipomoea triloba]
MKLRSPAIRFPYTLSNLTKSVNHCLYRAITTHNYLSQYPENYLASCSCKSQSFTVNGQEGDIIDLDVLPRLQKHGFFINTFLLNKVVSTCAKTASLSAGFQIHSQIIRLGFGSNVHVNTSLVDMYGKFGTVSLAQKLFDEMPEKNAVTWNALISGYVDASCSEIALGVFVNMLREGVDPTPFSVSTVLVGYMQLEAFELGAQLHALSVKAGFNSQVAVGTGLIDIYSRCLNIEASRRVFDEMPHKNVTTWTSMVTGYAWNQCKFDAMILVKSMLFIGIKPNCKTYTSLLSSFCCPHDLVHCKQIHSLNQLTWNVAISGFSNLGAVDKALINFGKMRQAGFAGDCFTFTSILKAVGVVSGLEEGQQTHCLSLKTGCDSRVHVQNGLLSMYSRCGKLEDAERIFSAMGRRDLISWNSLLTCYAYHGSGREVITLFEQMKSSGIRPDSTTFLVVISACRHAGLIYEGLEFFDMMITEDSLPPPKVEHYACIVDLYCRAGLLHEAEGFIKQMPMEPDPSVLKALLSACRVHDNKEITLRCARKLVELCPNDVATYVLLGNVLATGGNWNDAELVRKDSCDRGMKKHPGCSWI